MKDKNQQIQIIRKELLALVQALIKKGPQLHFGNQVEGMVVSIRLILLIKNTDYKYSKNIFKKKAPVVEAVHLGALKAIK